MAHHQFQAGRARHVEMGVTVAFSLQQFSEVLKIRDAAGQLDPISLLACKLELLASVSQKNRHHLEHLKILPPCVRTFLGEFLHRVEQGELPAKHWLHAANQVLKLTTAPGQLQASIRSTRKKSFP